MIGQDRHSHQSRSGKCNQGRQEAPDDVQRFPHPLFYDSEKQREKGMGGCNLFFMSQIVSIVL